MREAHWKANFDGHLNTAMLKEIVRSCRHLGFASHDEGLLKGVSCVAVPEVDNSGKIFGAISISALVLIFESAAIYEIVARLRREAVHIQALLVKDVGYAADREKVLSGL